MPTARRRRCRDAVNAQLVCDSFQKFSVSFNHGAANLCERRTKAKDENYLKTMQSGTIRCCICLFRLAKPAILPPPFGTCCLCPMIEPTTTPEPVAKLNLSLDGPAHLSLVTRPERAWGPLLGGDDGKWIFESISATLKDRTVAQAA